MKKILLLLLLSSFLFAEINECKNDVYFANGIDTDDKGDLATIIGTKHFY